MENLNITAKKNTAKTKIAVPLTATTFDEIKKEASLLTSLSPDFIEWRADFFDEVNDFSIFKMLLFELKNISKNIPLIFTIRTKSQGGHFENSKDSYEKILTEAMSNSAISYVDIESSFDSDFAKKLVSNARNCDIKSIVSYHDFAGNMDEAEILRKFDELKNFAADVIKIAVFANSQADCDALINAAARFHNENPAKKIIAIAMGEHGLKSRTKSTLFGGFLTFAAGINASAPGQISISEMRKLID